MTGFTPRRNQSVTLHEATLDSPTLARLTELSRDSVARLQAISPLIAPALRASIQAGPIEGTTWCLLIDNNSAAAKLRQMLPALAAHLRSKGWSVEAIRIKVQRATLP